jgi:hypothetical protein
VDSNAPIDERGNEAQSGEEVSGELVVSGGDGAEVLDAAVGALDDVARFVTLGIEREEALAIGFVGDDGDGPAAVEQARRWSAS